jgi:hypothetical protein
MPRWAWPALAALVAALLAATYLTFFCAATSPEPGIVELAASQRDLPIYVFHGDRADAVAQTLDAGAAARAQFIFTAAAPPPLDQRRIILGALVDSLAIADTDLLFADAGADAWDPFEDFPRFLHDRGYVRFDRRCAAFCLDHWIASSARAAAALPPAVEFAAAPPELAIGPGWAASTALYRPMAEAGQVRLPPPTGPVSLEIACRADLSRLGGPVRVLVSAGDALVGQLELTQSGELLWLSPPFTAPSGQGPLVVTLVANRTYQAPDDRTPRSIAVARVALRAAD